nr:signal peptidase I [Patescibacteria group bacterium]
MRHNFVTEIIETTLTSIIVILVIYVTIAIPTKVQGASMEPTFYTGERILVEKVSKYFKDYEVGEVVVLHPPNSSEVEYIKRIIGIPGDIIKIMDCSVYVSKDNAKYKLVEPYLSADTCTEAGLAIKSGRSIILKENEYLVMGDNREKSADSRAFGVIT